MIETGPLRSPAEPGERRRLGATRRLLAALVVIYAFAHLDRQIINLLIEPLKHDLRLSDTQISLLQGFAFALFMAVAGLPIGRLVDTGRRTAILAAGVLVWGASTLGCSLVSTFAGLLALRMGVGAGEAVLTPSGHSIIADATPPERLGLAMAAFGVGPYLGGGLAFMLGAVLLAGVRNLGPVHFLMFAPLKVWQLVFLAVGAPTLPMALWALWLPEPKRLARAHGADQSMGAGVRFYGRHFSSVGLVNLTGGFTSVALSAMSAWYPTYLIRSFHWTASAAGAGFGLILMVFGAAGVVAGGLAGDAVVSRGYASGRLMTMGVTCIAGAPFACLASLTQTPLPGLFLLAPAIFLISMALGLLPSVQQAIAPAHLRGSLSALGTLTVNLLGLGLGPTCVALATDNLFGAPAAVGRSLALVSPVALLIAAGCAMVGLAPYARRIVPVKLDVSFSNLRC